MCTAKFAFENHTPAAVGVPPSKKHFARSHGSVLPKSRCASGADANSKKVALSLERCCELFLFATPLERECYFFRIVLPTAVGEHGFYRQNSVGTKLVTSFQFDAVDDRMYSDSIFIGRQVSGTFIHATLSK